MKSKSAAGWRAIAVAGLVSATTVPVLAAPVPSMPAEQYQGSVGYVTGGVGRVEARMFEKQLTSHPLAIELLQQAGGAEAFTADAMVRITDRYGTTVLDARAGGPFMLVDLKPGRYSVAATLDGRTLRRSVVAIARDRTARVTFEFPGPRSARLQVSRAEGIAEGGLGG